MSSHDTYLAVFTGSKKNARWQEWNQMTEEQRKAKEREGMAAWGAWMEKNKSAIVFDGGPLGKTKRASRDGITDISNELAAFIVVRAWPLIPIPNRG